jgi:hypothetical protein
MKPEMVRSTTHRRASCQGWLSFSCRSCHRVFRFNLELSLQLVTNTGYSAYPGVRAESLCGLISWFRTRANDALQSLFHELGIMHVCFARNERGQDTAPVDQKGSFAPFFPDRWGSALRILVPEVPYSSPYQCSTISTRCLPFRRIRPSLLSRSARLGSVR